jgi:hypothetical protein
MHFSYPFHRDCQICEVDLGGVIVVVCQRGDVHFDPGELQSYINLVVEKEGQEPKPIELLVREKGVLRPGPSVWVIALSKRSEEIRCTVFGVASIVCLPFGSLVTCLRWRSVPTDVSSSTTASLTSTLGR